MRSALASCAVVAALACASSQPQPHPWATPGTDRGIWLSTKDWPLLLPASVLRVKTDALQRTREMLAARDSVPLTGTQVADLAEAPECARSEGTPYLVRGLAYGGYASFTAVRQDQESGWVAVWQGTYPPEISSFQDSQLATPLIVYLRQAPKRVFAIAEEGGENMFGRGLPHRRDVCSKED